jgi:hypothetical protein
MKKSANGGFFNFQTSKTVRDTVSVTQRTLVFPTDDLSFVDQFFHYRGYLFVSEPVKTVNSRFYLFGFDLPGSLQRAKDPLLELALLFPMDNFAHFFLFTLF